MIQEDNNGFDSEDEKTSPRSDRTEAITPVRPTRSKTRAAKASSIKRKEPIGDKAEDITGELLYIQNHKPKLTCLLLRRIRYPHG